MSNSPNDPLQDLLNRQADGQLSPEEAAQLADQLHQQPHLRDELGLQEDIDAALRHAFVPVGDPNAILRHVADATTAAVVPTETSARPAKLPHPSPAHSRRPWIVAAAALAAAVVLWFLVGIPSFPTGRRPVAFIQKPLEQIYHEEVARGFHEYWVCEEKPRFAATFYLRHGQALQLADFPAGTRMKGLSYLAGLSRDTTAMLALVDGQPVLVFVDKMEHDGPKAPGAADTVGLHRFRRELGNLVLYEVTPFDEPRVMPYLEPVEPPRDYLQQLPHLRDVAPTAP